MSEHGYYKDEVCGRNGCKGIIVDEPDYGLSCSCHINPPCSKCTTDWRRCPECDWSGEDDIREQEEAASKRINGKGHTWTLPKRRTIADLDNSKIDYVRSGSWHSGQKFEGVYPDGTTFKDIWEKLEEDGIRMDKYSMPKLNLYNGKFIFTHFTD